jgi:hypothetical protein
VSDDYEVIEEGIRGEMEIDRLRDENERLRAELAETRKAKGRAEFKAQQNYERIDLLSSARLADVNKFNAELAKAREDSARLDWLEKMRGWQGAPAEMWFAIVSMRKKKAGMKERPTFREAIDAARAAEECPGCMLCQLSIAHEGLKTCDGSGVRAAEEPDDA